MLASTIALLGPNGPHGKLERRPNVSPDRLEYGEPPVVRGYRWLDDSDRGMFFSVWDSIPSTPYATKLGPFPNHELFLVVDGSVTIVEPGNRESTFHAGDFFIFPQGCLLQWKLAGYFRKYAVGFKDPDWQEPADPATLRCVSLDLDAELEEIPAPPPDSFLGPVPVQHERRWFADPTGQLTVRIWDTTACHHKSRPAQVHEWTHVLDGSITLTDAAGMAHNFKKGDTFVAALGTVYGWRSPGYFRAIHSALRPKAVAAKALAAE
jgi:uncharacterized cupin superfamily protein